MKRKFTFLSVILFLFTFQACKKKSVDCAWNGIFGTYSVTNTSCSLSNGANSVCPPNGSYVLTVVRSSTCDTISVQNTGNLGVTTTAYYGGTVNENIEFAVPGQVFIYKGQSYAIEPTACQVQFNGTSFTMNLQTTHSGVIYMKGTKQ